MRCIAARSKNVITVIEIRVRAHSTETEREKEKSTFYIFNKTKNAFFNNNILNGTADDD